MNEEQNTLLLDLLTKKAVYGLDAIEQAQLDNFDADEANLEFESLEITAAAIGMAGLSSIEPMPAHLRSRILDSADGHFAAAPAAQVERVERENIIQNDDGTFELKPEKQESSWFGIIGWVLAAAALFLLAINIWFTRFQTPPVERGGNQTPTPAKLTPAQEYAAMVNAQGGMIKAAWTPGKDTKDVSGDVVWSEAKQAGYMRLKGLPVNDKTKEQYQLWIYDRGQDKKTPIDGGVFDIDANGEAIVPINAKLKAAGPEMFAITIEKPGGVVVSKGEKVAAIAKVETAAKSGS